MTDPVQIRAMANLARLEVPEAELPALVRDVGAILGYVDQLRELDAPSERVPAAPAASLRPDRVEPADLTTGPASFAPAFVDGFFVVPRPAAGDSK